MVVIRWRYSTVLQEVPWRYCTVTQEIPWRYCTVTQEVPWRYRTVRQKYHNSTAPSHKKYNDGFTGTFTRSYLKPFEKSLVSKLIGLHLTVGGPSNLEFDPCNPSEPIKMALWPKLRSLQQWKKLMKTKNTVLYYHDLSLVHETKKFGTQIILPLSDIMFQKKCLP